MAEGVLEKHANGGAMVNGKKKRKKMKKDKDKDGKKTKKKPSLISSETEAQLNKMKVKTKKEKELKKKTKKKRKREEESSILSTASSKKAKKIKKSKKRKEVNGEAAVEVDAEVEPKKEKASKVETKKKNKKSEKLKNKKAKKNKNKKKKQTADDAKPANGHSTSSTTKTLDPKLKSDPAEVEAFRKSHNISVHLPDADQEEQEYAPVTTFDQARSLFPPTTLEALDHCCKTFDKPSPIQAQSWPIVLAGRDLIGVAATGSGKTLAFVLPGIAKLLSASCGSANGSSSCPSPRMLVLSPTRELAIQSAKVLQEACEVIDGMEAMVIFGGQPKREQRSQLQQFGSSLDMIVATPGRLLDFIEDRAIELGAVKYLVLDEADRMLDMGFEKDVKRIISLCSPADRQTVMFSATWPQEIRSIASTYLTDAVRIVVGSEKLSASSSVKQHVEVIEPFAKEKRLKQLLAKIHDGKNRVIVFGLYKKECTRLEQNLLRQGFQVAGIHGDKAQHQREDAVRRFEKGELPILVATDVASRGLDIENVEYVVNYSFPLTVEDYVHRIGRTGRAGKRGVAYTFFTNHDKHLAGALQNVLRQAGAVIPEALSKFGNTVKKKTHKMYGAHFRQDDRPMKKATRIVFD